MHLFLPLVFTNWKLLDGNFQQETEAEIPSVIKMIYPTNKITESHKAPSFRYMREPFTENSFTLRSGFANMTL